jgi:MFS family permease
VAKSDTAAAAPRPRPWAHRDFRLLAVSAFISTSGNTMALVARPFAILAVGGGVAEIGSAVAAQTIPTLVLMLLAGAVTDHLRRERVLVWGNLAEATSEATGAILVVTGVGHPWQLIALAAVRGGGAAFVLPAEKALVAQTVPYVGLGPANAALQGGLQLSRIVAAALGGVIVGFAGPGWALAAIAAMFIIAAVVRFGMRITASHVSEKRIHVWRDLADGWREFRARQWLWVNVLQFSVVVAINTAVISVLGPLTVAHSVYGPQSWGLVLGATSLGALVGAGTMLRWRPQRPMRTATAVVFVAVLPPLGLAVPVTVPILCLTTFVTGLGMTVFGVIWATTMQQRIPLAMQSRMFAYDAIGSEALTPVAAVLVGPAVAMLGSSTTLLFAAGLSATATGAAFLSPQIRSGLPDRDQSVEA